MLRHLLILATVISAQANPWSEIFKPHPHWNAAQGVTAKDKTLLTQHGHAPTLFTNASNPKKSGYLETLGKFGDCTVEAEFMIPKGSNSGIYLQGRYEVQILDSFGKEKAGDGDMGGIYHRWDNQRTPKGYEGHAPKTNAAKAPGEWQKLLIRFRAPRLDRDGKVTEKPIFLSVLLNDQEIHRNVTVHGPTRSAQRKGFADKDPIFIQGDHGPIAFRKFLVTQGNFEKPNKKK